MKDLIDNWYLNIEDEFLNALSPLIVINSVKGKKTNDAPFGEGPKKALDYALRLANSYGFITNNIDNFVGTVDINNKEDELHILAHLDVVGVGDGWKTNPFELVRNGDTIYGRGVDDDKGPAIAALFALKCVRELNIPLKKNVKLIFGTDEECGSSDIGHYYSKFPYAPHSVTPDAEFPIINIEKGHYTPIFNKEFSSQENSKKYIKSINGGIRTNVAPGYCKATIVGIDISEIEELSKVIENKSKLKFKLSNINDNVLIEAIGKEAHASTPDEGINAITGMLDLLSMLNLDNCESFNAINNLHHLFPFNDNSGSALGIAQEDKLSGNLTLTLSMLELNDKEIWGQFDSRCPMCANDENLVKITENAFRQIGFSCVGDKTNVHFVDENSDFIRTLLKCYEMYSNKKGYCMAIGGGTYVHDIPGGVAFGAGDVNYDSHLHGANERARISQLIMCSKIYAEMIIELCS